MHQNKDIFRLHVIQNIEKKQLLSYGESVLVALSGGADSVALLSVLCSIRGKYALNLAACHVHHGIRGNEADDDAEFCRHLCANMGIDYFEERVNVPEYCQNHKLSLELGARELRYNSLKKIADVNGYHLIATAHNANDNAETLLYNVIRGSSVSGMCAIPPSRDNIIRPLYNITRDKIEEYLCDNDLPHIFDSTNSCNDYTRNFIRNNIVPLCKKVNPAFFDATNRLSENARENESFFDSIDPDMLYPSLRAHKCIRCRDIYKHCKTVNGGKEISYKTVNDIYEACKNRKHAFFNLSNGCICEVKNGKYAFCLKKSEPEIKQKLQATVLNFGRNLLLNGEICIDISKTNKCFNEINKFSTTKTFVSDIIINGLLVRSRRQGDSIVINGLTKYLKKEFINKKIPLEYRDTIPVICYGEDIVFVPFIGLSDKYKNFQDRNTELSVTFKHLW